MTMSRKALSVLILGLQGRMIHRGRVYFPWVKQILTKANDMEHDESKRHQADLDLFRGS